MKHLIYKLSFFCLGLSIVTLPSATTNTIPKDMPSRQQEEKLEMKINKLIEEEYLLSEKARDMYREADFMALSRTEKVTNKFRQIQEALNTFKFLNNINKSLLEKAEKNISEIRSDIQNLDYTQAEGKITQTLSFIALTPVLSINVSPKYFSPDNDGYNDILTITPVELKQANFPTKGSLINIKTWNITIYKEDFPETNRGSPTIPVPVKTFSGKDKIPSIIKWDGMYDDDINRVDSDSIYTINFSAIDSQEGVAVPDFAKIKTGIYVNHTPRGNIIEISQVLFDFDKADIKTEYRSIIERINEKMKRFKDYTIAVEGHADYVGSATYNAELSQRRADAVTNYLSTIGFPDFKMISFGYGESLPRTLNKEKSALNRRVTFILFRTDKDKISYFKKYEVKDRSIEIIMKGAVTVSKN